MSGESLEPVSLRGLAPFASGGYRYAFIHPTDNTKCIKIDHGGILGRIPSSFFRRVLNGNTREVLEYRRLMSANVPYEQYFPRFYGTIETDLGPGICVELIRGTDGKLPVSIDEYILSNKIFDRDFLEFLRQEYKTFWHFCEKNLILSSSVELRNVGIIQINGTLKLVSFDIKQTRSKKLFSIVEWSAAVKKQRIRRRFARHMKHLDAKLAMA